jgi:mevalonate kinase
MESFNSKILLFGEYTVLHNSMALVVPCDLYSGRLDFYEKAPNKKFALQSNEYLKKFSGFIASHMDENFVLEVKMLEKELESGLFFQSNIPQGYGLGSSGALVVAIFLRYLKKAKSVKDDFKVVTYHKMQVLKNALAKLESFFHGVSSGLDPLSIILNEPLLYKSATDIETTALPQKKEDGKNVVFLLNTHIARNTSELMKKFDSLRTDQSFQTKLKEELVWYNNNAIDQFLKNDVDALHNNLFNISSFQLSEMHEFIPQNLHSTVEAGLENGDYLLKLCGAGGGGFMLGFTRDWKKTSESLRAYDIQPIFKY